MSVMAKHFSSAINLSVENCRIVIIIYTFLSFTEGLAAVWEFWSRAGVIITFPAVLPWYPGPVLVLSSVCYCLLLPGPGQAPPLSPSQAPPGSAVWELQLRPWEIGLRLLELGPGWQGFVMLSGLILVMIIIFYDSLIPLHAQHSNPHSRYFSGASVRDITLSNLLPSFRSIKSKCFCRLRFIREWTGTYRPGQGGDGVVLIVLIDVTGRTNRNVYTRSSSSSKCGAGGGEGGGGGGDIKLSGPLGRK